MASAHRIQLGSLLLALACSKPVRRNVATSAVPNVDTSAASQDAGIANASGSGPMTLAVTMVARSGSKAAGSINLEQTSDGVTLVGLVQGLSANAKHGLHIAQTGNCDSSDASSAGGDFSPTLGEQHLSGALDAISTDASGVAIVNAKLAGFSLNAASSASMLGKALLIYQKSDDAPGQANSSARWSCGVIDAQNTPTADKVSTYTTTLISAAGLSPMLTGHLTLQQVDSGIAVSGSLSGLTAGAKYHLQLQANPNTAECTGDFSSVGSELAPFMVPSDDGSAPATPLGDLGTAVADSSGKASITITRPGATLTGSSGVLGRAVVVALASDTVNTGFTGPLLACGVIR